MAERVNCVLFLALFLARTTYVSVNATTTKPEKSHIFTTDRSEADDNDAYSEQNYNLAHFFNGSYSAHDVLEELLNNKSLTNTSVKRK